MNGADDFSPEARKLLGYARKPRDLSREELARTSARLAPVAIGVGASALFSAKAIAAIVTVGIAAVVGTVAISKTRWNSHRIDAFSIARPAHRIAHLQVRAAPDHSIERTIDSPNIAANTATETTRVIEAAPSQSGTRTTEILRARHRNNAPHPEVTGVVPETTQALAPATLRIREDECLSRAEALLQTNPLGSLQQINACAAMYPSGNMVAERELLAIEALRRSGNATEARNRANAFSTRFPNSIYADRLAHIIATLE